MSTSHHTLYPMNSVPTSRRVGPHRPSAGLPFYPTSSILLVSVTLPPPPSAPGWLARIALPLLILRRPWHNPNAQVICLLWLPARAGHGQDSSVSTVFLHRATTSCREHRSSALLLQQFLGARPQRLVSPCSIALSPVSITSTSQHFLNSPSC